MSCSCARGIFEAAHARCISDHGTTQREQKITQQTYRWLSRPDVVPTKTKIRTTMPTKITLKFSGLSVEVAAEDGELSALIRSRRLNGNERDQQPVALPDER